MIDFKKEKKIEKLESVLAHLRFILSHEMLDTYLNFNDDIFGQLADCTNKKSTRAGSFCQRAKRSRRVLYQQCNVSE